MKPKEMKNERTRHLESLLVICLGMVVMFFVWDKKPFLWVGLGLGLAGLLVPMLGRYIHLGWTGIGHVLGWINTNIILALLFFLVLLPLALLRRAFAKDPMGRKKKQDGSYFVEREHTFTKKDLEKPW